ncbi:hypothetical protein CI109_104494 [Kwoniella shandongensis]|uniref:Uncharacterized protein n=1 Tax=Kwoniella shandongensis TaxID=1734106 RepID=A0A5M6BTC7_9TREE|nr:uncharacterized protein CI109_006805 [Kwoniella shandongensis]KAA5524855.1 hypothetical protein CI109_006805 [Kwoniella shandongensis]
MCTQHEEEDRSTLNGNGSTSNGNTKASSRHPTNSKMNGDGDGDIGDGLPDWENIELPPDHILSHLTDAHCHPTDLTHAPEVYDAVSLGGLASMATIVDDQDRVRALSEEKRWYSARDKGKGKEGRGVGVVACFGYHPWFTHHYTLSSGSSLPSKEDHYTSLFLPPNSLPTSKNHQLLLQLLPYLPDPIPFEGLLDKLRADMVRSKDSGRLTMLGEVGLDGSARMRWPKKARHLHPDYRDEVNLEDGNQDGEGEEWKRLTPFKVPMAHQRAILEAQMEIAIDLGMNVSLHSVSCAGPTLDTLIGMRDKHGMSFTNRINVDLHSAGGWSPPFWTQAERNLLNLYASPSIFITGRSPSASQLIKSISPERILVESDSHDVRLSSRLVWAAAEWVSRCKGWKLEGRDGNAEEWDMWDDGETEEFDENGNVREDGKGEVWTVRTLERNWATFMGLIDD